MRLLLPTLLLLALVGCAPETQKEPNVILFVVDDLGWTDLSSYGSDLYQTPNVDFLAETGMKFTDAYAACTVCSPSRSSLMTGKYPARINCTDWISGHEKPFAKMKIPDWTQYMAPEEVTLAEALKSHGYQTIHIGKWHLGEVEKYWPEAQGFDENIGGWSVGAPQKRDKGNGYFPPYLNPRLEDGPEGEYLTERLAREAVEYIERNKDSESPFFMNFWLYNVHTPLQAKEEKIEKYRELAGGSENHKNPVYAAMVEHMDDAIGRVITKLEETGQLDNTLIVFTSDNGGLIGNFRGMSKVTSNVPLRSGKGDMYEGAVRVPFIVKWKGKISEGTSTDIPVISPDVYPTILGLLGLEGNKDQNASMDGSDLSGVLTQGQTLSREAIYWHYPHYHLEGAKPYSAIRKGDWKLVEIFENEGLELYNLKDDIGETHNLADTHPDKVTELKADLDTWRRGVGAQLPEPNPLYFEDFEEEWKKWDWGDKTVEEFLEHLKSSKESKPSA